MKSPLLSVIVCTYNRSTLLKNCITSLIDQKIEPCLLEILIIDNNSTDHTRAVVNGFKRTASHIHYIKEPNQGLSHARNRGFHSARSDYLLYIDDDAIAPPGYIESILEIIDNHSPDIGGGPVFPYYTTVPPVWFKNQYEIRQFARTAGFSETCNVSGSNFLIKKEVLLRAGLFDINLGMKGDKIAIGEEAKVLETYRNNIPKKKHRVYYGIDNFILHHVPAYKMTVKYCMIRYFRGGRMTVKLGRVNMTKKKTVQCILQFPFQLFITLYREIRKNGYRRTDYIEIIRFNVFFQLGMVTEALLQDLRSMSKILFQINNF